MRPGLVAIGVSFLVLGGATLAAVYVLPGTAQQSQDTTVIQPLFVGGHSGGERVILGTNSTSGTLRISWSSTVPLSVSVQEGPSCPTPSACPVGATVANWSSSTSGAREISGPLRFPYQIAWSDVGPSAGSFQANAVAIYHTPNTLPMLTLLLIDGAAGTLIVIGGVALFLGLFLRAGVYSGAPSPPGTTIGPKP